MKQICLLIPYQNHGVNEVITVSDDIADDLIQNSTARLCTNRDFLVKSEFGESKAIDTLKLKKGRLKQKEK